MALGFLKALSGIGKAIGGVATNLFTGQANSAMSAARQQAYNERNMALQHEYQKKMVDYINDYNLPTKSVARWQAAGISPQAVYGNSPGGAGVSSDASAPSSDNPGIDARSFNFTQTLAERQRMENEKKVADSQADLNEALAAKARGDTKDSDLVKRLQLLDVDRAEIAKESEGIQKDILDIEKDYREYEKQADLSIKQQILFETMAKIDKLLADKEVSEEMKEKLQTDRDLIQEQINTEKVKQRSLDADARYKDAIRETENLLRSGKHKLQTREIMKVVYETFGQDLSNARQIEEIARLMTATDRPSSIPAYLDKIAEQIGGSDQDAKWDAKARLSENLGKLLKSYDD